MPQIPDMMKFQPSGAAMFKDSTFLKFGVLAGLLLAGIVITTGIWLDRNKEQVVDYAIEATGVKDAIAAERKGRCERAKRQAQLAWDRAVDSGRPEKYADQIDALDAEVRELCSGQALAARKEAAR